MYLKEGEVIMIKSKSSHCISPKLSINLQFSLSVKKKKLHSKSLRLDCSRLPWIGKENDILEAVNNVINTILTNKKQPSFLYIRKKVSICISDLLKREKIDISPEIAIICEEYTAKVAEKVRKPKNSETWLTIQSYEKTIVNKSNEIDYTDLTIDKNVKLKLEFNPKENQLKLPIKLKKTDQVVVSFFGDGATGRGAFHEALNWASVYKLPIIFVNENNQYASTAKYENTVPVKSIADRAKAYNMPGVSIDGNDLFSVYDTAKEAIERARGGEGPTLIEAKTYRLKGHFVGDPEKYREKEEVENKWLLEPIGRLEKQLMEKGVLTDDTKQEIYEGALNEVKASVKFARESSFPDKRDALTDLFADDYKYDYY